MTTETSATTASATPALEAAPASVPATAPATATPGFSIAALVTGIVGIVGGQWWLSVAAIVLGFVARNREPQSRIMANWGLVLGFVGAFGWLIVGILGVAFFAPFALAAPFWF